MLQTLRQAPFLRMLLFFSLGILFSYSFSLGTTDSYLSLFTVAYLLTLISFLPLFGRNYDYRWLFGSSLMVLCFSLACLLTTERLSWSEWNFESGSYNYHFLLNDDPELKPKSLKCKAEIVSADEPIHSSVAGKNVIIYLPLDSLSLALLPGDRIAADVSLSQPVPDSQSGFDYATYLRKQGLSATGFVRRGNWQKIESGRDKVFSIHMEALKIRKICLNFMEELIPDTRSASIASAMILGYRNDMDKELVQSFSATGVLNLLPLLGQKVKRQKKFNFTA